MERTIKKVKRKVARAQSVKNQVDSCRNILVHVLEDEWSQEVEPILVCF